MLKFGNKEFRNLQEQVEENMKDIEKLKNGQAVLDEFGIKVVGEVSDIEDLPTVAEYKESTPDWEYGDAYAVGTESPYTMYILTRANDTHDADYWFDIGIFPEPGPQGEQGPTGETGPQGPTGDTGPTGADAGFGTPTASATQYSRGTQPTVTVEASGPNTEKVFSFAFGIPSGAPSVTLSSTSGTLTLTQFNMLQDQADSVILQRVSAGASIVYYTLQRWYKTEDYMYFICLYRYSPNSTSFRVCQIDLHNRNYIITSDAAMKVGRYNISSYDPNISGNVSSGKVLTADGNGGASWEDAIGGGNSVTINVISGTFSDSDYIKVAGEGCTIIYDDNTTKVSFRKYDETSTTITYAGPFTEGNITYWYGLTISKTGKTWVMSSSAMPISATNIKSGSHVSGLVLTTNGSGGSSWESLPTPTALAWGNITGTLSNQTDLKNALDGKQDELTEPETPTGTIYEYLGFTSAGVVSKNTMVPVSKISDIADVAITGSYTDLLNQPSIPDPQVQSNWTQTNSSKIDYIKNKPTLAAVATSGSYTDLSNTPTIPAAQVNSDWDAASGVAQILNKPTLGTAAAKDYTSSVTSGSADLVTSGAVYTAIDNIPEPMIFKGSLGTGGTITSLPAASSANEGFVYKVIEDGTYAGQAAKVGDTFISDGSNWVLIPSGDEPSGTVTSVGMTVPTGLTVSGSPITSSGTLAVSLATGYEIPTTTTLNSFAVAANLASVATSGDYDDLLNKPTIPDVSHMLTDNTSQSITGNKTFIATTEFNNMVIFKDPSSAYLSSIVIPANSKADLVSFKGFKDVSSTYRLLIPATSGYTADKTIATTDDIPTIPTNISSFTNDSGYITGINSSDVTTALGYTPLAITACTYQTSAPTAAIADGGVHIVYLSSEPSTKYSGYIYMIAEA